MGQVEWCGRTQSTNSNCVYISCIWETQILHYKMSFTLTIPSSFLLFPFMHFFYFFGQLPILRAVSNFVHFKDGSFFLRIFPFQIQCLCIFDNCHLKYLKVSFQRLLCYFTECTVGTDVFTVFSMVQRIPQWTCAAILEGAICSHRKYYSK